MMVEQTSQQQEEPTLGLLWVAVTEERRTSDLVRLTGDAALTRCLRAVRRPGRSSCLLSVARSGDCHAQRGAGYLKTERVDEKPPWCRVDRAAAAARWVRARAAVGSGLCECCVRTCLGKHILPTGYQCECVSTFARPSCLGLTGSCWLYQPH